MVLEQEVRFISIMDVALKMQENTINNPIERKAGVISIRSVSLIFSYVWKSRK